jgi:hypothetical protein
MATSAENQCVAFAIKYVALGYEDGEEVRYVLHSRQVVCTKRRAIALAKAFVNRVHNFWEEEDKHLLNRRERYCRVGRKSFSLRYVDLLYVSIREVGKGKQEEIVIRA